MENVNFKAPIGRNGLEASLEDVQFQQFADMFKSEMAKYPDLKVRKWSVGNGGRYFPTTKQIIVPLPKSRRSLYVCFHEIGHHAQGNIKPRYLEEMRAEQWAHAKMREYGLSVPMSMVRRAKQYVARCVNKAISRGHKNADIKEEVIKWLGDYKGMLYVRSEHASKYDHLRKVRGEA